MKKIFHKKPLVSVIINCLNGSEFLIQALKSVKKQTYKNFEVIFWDNKSSDNSKKIFNSLKDKRFKYFLSNKRTTLYEARNLAIAKSKGEFISFIDTDDIWDKKKLELQMPLFEDQEVGVVYSKLWVLNNLTGKKKLYIKGNLPSGNIFNELIKNYYVGIITTIVRKKALSKIKKFNKKFTHIGDFDLFLKISRFSKFAPVQKPLATWRTHEKNLTIIEKDKAIFELETWLKMNKKILSSNNFLHIKSLIDFRKMIYYRINSKYFKCLKYFFRNHNLKVTIKKIFIVTLPIIVLKRLFWY
tara:strand:+ start:80 stop:979 length:900 start_codon:yes stop_codon:yes gene_type:complete